MNQELAKIDQEDEAYTAVSERAVKKREYPQDLLQIDIAMIGAVGFHRLIQKKENTVFVTSLYEINRILKEREAPPTDETNEQLVDRLLPEKYASRKAAFSKAESDTLPPHRPYDHRIQLEKEDHGLGYSPLYQ